MSIVKRLVFALPFILSLIGFIYYLNYFLESTANIFSLDLQVLWQVVYLTLALLSTTFFFVIFSALACTWWLVNPLAALASFSAVLIIPNNLIGLVVSSALILFFIISYVQISKKMSTYLTFKATALLDPSAKQLTTLILLVATLAFYLAADLEIKQNGFQLPDSILETSLNIATSQMGQSQAPVSPTLPTLTPLQIQTLKKNPELLKQYGLDPAMLDQITSQPNNQLVSTTSLVKPVLQKQIQSIISPYQAWIPAILAVFFFLTIKTLSGFLSFFFWILLWLIFWVLEKVGFTHYITETREVKKLVV